MIVYITATIISMLFANYAANCKHLPELRKTYITLCIGSFLPFFLVSALRYDVGTDYDFIYKKYFYYINEGTDKFTEPLFNFINIVAYHIKQDPVVMFAIVSFLIYIFVFMAIHQQSEHVCLSILVFVISGIFFNSMNQIRQAITMAMFLYSLKYLFKRDAFNYFIIVLIACTIHTSAIIYIPIYFLYNYKADLRVHLTIFLCSLVGSPILKRLIIFVISKTKYAWYLGSLFDENNFYLIGFLFSFIILVVAHFYYHYGENQDNKEYNFFLNMEFIGMMSLLFSATIPQADRIYYCFNYIEILFVPLIVFSEKKPTRRTVLYFGIFAFYMTKLLYDVYVNKWYYVIPYQTFFSR